MSLSFFGNKNKSNISVIFDIGSDSVGYAILKTGGKAKPKILFSGRALTLLQNQLDFNNFLDSTKKSLKSACLDLERNGFKHLNFSGDWKAGIKNFHFFLSSPWSVSKTKTLQIKKDREFLVDEKLLSTLLEKEELEFRAGKAKDEAYFLENKIMSSKLNGYKTKDIFHKKTKELEMSIYQSMASKQAVISFKEVLENTFHFHAKVYFHSWGYASYLAFQGALGLTNFNLLDITGEITDIITVRNGVIDNILSFPSAKETLLKSLAGKLGLGKPELLSLLSMRSLGKLSDIENIKISTALKQSGAIWASPAREVFGKIEEEIDDDVKFFVMGPSDIAPLFSGIMKEEVLPKFGITNKEPILVNNSFFADKIASDLKADSFLLSEGLYIESEFNLYN